MSTPRTPTPMPPEIKPDKIRPARSGFGSDMPACFEAAAERVHRGLPPGFHPELNTDPNLAYFRKSSEDGDKQTLSIPAQRREVERLAGRRPRWEFYEAFSGTTFNGRPAFQVLLGVCRANPQPRDEFGNASGTIWCYDYDRFSRQQTVVAGRKKPDTNEMLRVLLDFDKYGWKWHFVKSPPTGHQLGDMIVGLVKFEQAAGFSSKQSEIITERKAFHALDEQHGGYWQGGTPPYPAVRVDAATQRRLGPGEWTQEQHRVILQLDPQQYVWWKLAAEQVIAGKSPEQAAEILRREGAPLGPTMRGWTRRVVIRMLTNTALIGWPVYRLHAGDGERYKARWGALVDEQLFQQVNEVLASRKRSGRRKVYENPTPLRLTCPQCEVEYHMGHPPAGRRIYRHPAPKGSRSYEWRMRAQERGCANWILDAEDAERQVFDLIRAERLSPDWHETMRQEHLRQQQRVKSTEARESEAKRALEKARRERQAISDAMDQLEDPKYVRQWERKLAAKDAEIEKLKHQWQQARAATAQADDGWELIEHHFREAEQLARAFHSGDLEKRRLLFSYWVEAIDVHMTDLPEPGHSRRMKRYKAKAKAKKLAVFLTTAPEIFKVATLPSRYGAGGLCARGRESRNPGA